VLEAWLLTGTRGQEGVYVQGRDVEFTGKQKGKMISSFFSISALARALFGGS
jgi:hypothetical protein